MIGSVISNLLEVLDPSFETQQNRPRTIYGGPWLALVLGSVTYVAVRAGIVVYEGDPALLTKTGDQGQPVLFSYVVTGLAVGFGPRNAADKIRAGAQRLFGG